MSQRNHPFVLVTGGCRSGKSGFAQKYAEASGDSGLYVATAESSDDEMGERIKKHQDARGSFWTTWEVSRPELPELGRRLPDRAKNSVVLFDCLTLWASGCLDLGMSDRDILQTFEHLCGVFLALPRPVVLVSNEVGMGLVPENSLGRRFRDLAGFLNQKAAQQATHVVLMVSGLPLPIKGVLREDRQTGAF